ncbi:MAG: DegV family protein [Eubacteriales bacterium]|nr:DegV family protein [Eubacteriales bacterium]
MSYRIIGDSCLDLTEELKKDKRFVTVPLTLQVDDATVIDDDTFDQKRFLRMVKESFSCPKSACPSPEAFKEAMECDADDVYVITLSSHLSGSYNSAVVGRELYEEEHGAGTKNIVILDSESASAGQLNMALAIVDMYEEGLGVKEISEKILKQRAGQGIYFVLDTLEYLRKNGRLTGLQAFFATALNIKPVMGAERGVIVKLDQARGLNKAYSRMCDIAVRNRKHLEADRLVIAHCNCPDRAQQVKAEMEKRGSFKEVVIAETAGVASMYAGDGGIVMSVWG